MSEQPLPEPTTEVENTTPLIPIKKKPPAKGFNIVRLEKRITATFSIMAKVFVIALISIAAIFIARELGSNGYVITQINVPASFEEAGYTGPVVAKRISNQLNEIIRITRAAEIAHNRGGGAAPVLAPVAPGYHQIFVLIRRHVGLREVDARRTQRR
jgi:hypothetical protein